MSNEKQFSRLASLIQRISGKQVNSWSVRFHRVVGGILVFLGLVFVVLPISHILAEPEATLYTMAVGMIPIALAFGVIAAGGWLFQYRIPNHHALQIGQWFLTGMAITTVMGLVILAYQRHAGVYLSWFPALLTVTNNTTAGTLGGFAVGFYNIQSQMQMEKLADEREKLALTMRILRHDIRNDLTVITGMAEMISDDVPESGQQYLSKLERASDEAVTLTETAREFVTAIGEDDRDTKPVALAASLENQVETAQETYSHAKITVDGAIPRVSVEADEMLSSIFRNLLANAVQHNDKKTPVIEVSTTVHEDEVEIEIADNGRGVPDGRKEDVFGRGEKGLESAGTGLGLYLVDTLVDAYGGHVWISDNDPTGAVFHVVLPMVEESDSGVSSGGRRY